MDTRNEDRHVPSVAYGSEKRLMTQESIFHEKEVRYLGERKKMNHEGRWLGIFQLDREESTHLEKMTKCEATKKVGLKMSIQQLQEERIESQPLGPPKEEGQLGAFWGETLKGEHSEKIRKGPATNITDTTLVLVLRVAN